MSIILPINCGYYQFKSQNDQIFKSRISEITSENIQTNNDIIKYEGSLYLIGNGKKNINLNKTEDSFLKICILNMCARFMTSGIEDFKLLLTSPPLTYQEHQETIPKSLIGVYQIEWNGKDRIISISDVVVFPETFTAYLSNSPCSYVNKILFIIDIGGYTTNICKINDGNFDINSDYITIPKGNYFLDSSIRDFLIANEHITCSLDDIAIYKKNNFDKFKCKNGISSIYKSFVNDLIEETKIKEWNLQNAEILVTGGGGKDIFDFINLNYFPQSKLSSNPIFDNLYGLETLVEEVFVAC